MPLEYINHICNAIILLFCIWAVLDPRVRTQLAGTLALSAVGICSFLNITTPTWFGIIPAQYATALNISLALSAIIYRLKWRDERKIQFRKMLFGRRSEDEL